jgi:hypothetical protein
MGLADRLKDLKTKAVDATVERSDKIHEAVEKVASTADERTGGKYRDQIQKAGAKAGSLLDGLAGPEQQPAAGDGASAPGEGTASTPAQSAESVDAAPSPNAQAEPSSDAQAEPNA